MEKNNPEKYFIMRHEGNAFRSATELKLEENS